MLRSAAGAKKEKFERKILFKRLKVRRSPCASSVRIGHMEGKFILHI